MFIYFELRLITQENIPSVSPEPVQSGVVSSTSSDKTLPADKTDQSGGSGAVQRADPVSETDQSLEKDATHQEVELGEIDRLVERLISEVVITASKHRSV